MLRPAAPSRFTGIRRGRARIVLAALAALLLLSLTALAVPGPPALDASTGVGSDVQTDLMLYEKIVGGVKGGDNYYHVAADALRAGQYPLRPFLTFRLPALATVLAALPGWLPPRYLLFALVFLVAAVWFARLRPIVASPVPAIASALLLVGSMLAFLQGDLAAFHEIWAGLLIALSLALRRPGRWIEAVAVALAAMLIRETAALYVIVMGVTAWIEGERREARGWAAALALFAAALGLHAWAVAGVTGPLDPASPGWAGLLGFGFFVKAIGLATALQLLPVWAAALLAGLALFGWASWRDPLGLRMTLTLLAYAAAIGIFARLDTFYWALIVAPVFLLGLLFVPGALRDLFVQALDRRRITVTRVPR